MIKRLIVILFLFNVFVLNAIGITGTVFVQKSGSKFPLTNTIVYLGYYGTTNVQNKNLKQDEIVHYKGNSFGYYVEKKTFTDTNGVFIFNNVVPNKKYILLIKGKKFLVTLKDNKDMQLNNIILIQD